MCEDCRPPRLRRTAEESESSFRAAVAAMGGEVVGPYGNSATKCAVRCGECGHVWSILPFNALNGHWCRICSIASRRRETAFLDMVAARGGSVPGPYVSSRTHIVVRCAAGHEWTTRPTDVVSGHWCKTCCTEGHRDPVVEEEFRAAVKSHGGTVVGPYKGGSTKCLVVCARGHSWLAHPRNVRIGHWCAKCQAEERRKPKP